MTAQILHLRDYETAEERQIKLERFLLNGVEEAVGGYDWPQEFPAPDDGDVA